MSNISTFDEPSDAFVQTIFVPELFEHNATHSPDHPAFAYESTLGSGDIRIVDWKGLNEACKKAADYVDTVIGGRVSDSTEPVIIGVLGNLDTITYCTLLSGIWLTGAVPFLISPRNSPAAVAHLLAKTNVSTLLVSADKPMQSLAKAALWTLDAIKVVATPKHGYLFDSVFNKTEARPFPTSVTEESPAMILHSSGSTGFPKPITITQRVLRQWMTGRLQKDATLPARGLRMAAHVSPIFHAIGSGNFLAAIRCGSTLAVFPPSDPPIVPSPKAFLNSALATKCDVLWTIPAFLELWSREPADIEKLKSFRVIPFGGGPLGRDVGNNLVAEGVPILNCFGATEFGVACAFLSEPYPDWEWITLASRCNPYFRPLDDPEQFELIFLESERHTPSILNFEVNGVSGFATNDIVLRHPTDSRKIQILGRVDDQIMLSTGEKTNPGPIEAIVARNGLVSAALMFGRGRDQNGIIVQPRNPSDATDEATIIAFREHIWPSIEEANAYAPSHSKIFKEMIIVANPSKVFQMTPKNTIKRKPTLADYEEEIEATYLAVEQSAQQYIEGPSTWTPIGVHGFVRRVVCDVMEGELSDEDDIFLLGGDSLRATWIRNSILFSMRKSKHSSKVHVIGQDFVYKNPSIAKLTHAILCTIGVTAGKPSLTDEATRGVDEIEALVTEFTQDFPVHKFDPARVRGPRVGEVEAGEVVLVTGTTGGLGAQLVATLAANPSVSRVYALNRPSNEGTAAQRQRQAFVDRGLDVQLLDGDKVVVVEGDLEDTSFGINRVTYDEIRDCTTLIIHTAWRVNFVLGASAFLPLIRGTRNIVDLSLSSPRPDPPRIIFTSTVGVFLTWESEEPPHEGPISAAMVALGNGYTRSKYVAERVLEAAGETTPLRPVIVRVGQMTSTVSGAWNKSDWLPAIVRSGQVVDVLPNREDDVAWVPLDLAANALWDFRNAACIHLNLEHPTPYTWSSIFNQFSQTLDVPLVSWTDWLERLELTTKADPSNSKRNPASMLMGFFKSAPATASPGKRAPGNIPFLSLTNSLASSESLRLATVQEVEVKRDVERWVAHWKYVGLLN